MHWWSQKKFWLVSALIIILVVGGWFVFAPKNNTVETITVKRMDLIQTVNLTGRVKAENRVELALEQSGRVISLPFSVGSRVPVGAVIVGLDSSSLAAELRAAEADLRLRQTQTANTEVNLDQVHRQQDTLVANAYSQLLSSDLMAVPSSDDYGATAPLISGRYGGFAEGTYKLIIRHGPSLNGKDYRLWTFGLEQTGPIEISNTKETPLGTRGLFVSFPDQLPGYDETIWYATLPNTRNANYLTNYNTHQAALETRRRAIEEAQSSLVSRKTGTVVEAELASAQAAIDRLQSQINQRRLRAPFTGILAKLEPELGETIGAGETLATLISDKNFIIEADVPEADIAKIKIGDGGQMTLDAYGDDVNFPLKVSLIAPAEVLIDGVPTYRVTLQLLQKDKRIKSGLTANIEVVTARRDKVLAVPARAVSTSGSRKTVRVIINDKLITRTVTTGLRDSAGNIEITRGLKVGDKVVTYAPNNRQ